MVSTTTKKKRKIFDAIDALESQDIKSTRNQQFKTHRDGRRTKAAQSQIQLYQKIMEVRILLQRTIQLQKEKVDNEDTKSLNKKILKILVEARCKLIRKDSNVPHSAVIDENTIQSDYNICRREWKEVLNRRYKDLRLHSGISAKSQFKLLNSSFWEQVESVATYSTDKDFDDSKLYQHQLHDFLMGKNESDPSGRNVLHQRKNRSTSSQGVDRKASKGRKIRYAVHPKLVNFTFSVQRPINNDNGIDEDKWFSSLFGGRN